MISRNLKSWLYDILTDSRYTYYQELIESKDMYIDKIVQDLVDSEVIEQEQTEEVRDYILANY